MSISSRPFFMRHLSTKTIFFFLSAAAAHASNLTVSDLLKEIPDDHFASRSYLQSFLQDYNETEIKDILEDFASIRTATFTRLSSPKPSAKPEYLATAGAPGSGKSTLLEKILKSKAGQGQRYAYIDPDRVSLRSMGKTYLKDIKLRRLTLEGAYQKWRGASNFIANTLLALALKEGYPIAHGTTSTAPKIGEVFQAIKTKYGYTVTLLHLTCNEEVRKLSNKQRNAKFFQCSDKDFMEKKDMFLDRFRTYLESVDQIFFWYRDTFTEFKLAAHMAKTQSDSALEK